MIVQKPYSFTSRVFAKKRKKTTSFSSSQILKLNENTLNKNVAGFSHYALRLQSLQNQLGKARRPLPTRSGPKQQQKYGVEFSDDVIIIDRHGRRISPPDYAVFRIDQLPQFKKD